MFGAGQRRSTHRSDRVGVDIDLGVDDGVGLGRRPDADDGTERTATTAAAARAEARLRRWIQRRNAVHRPTTPSRCVFLLDVLAYFRSMLMGLGQFYFYSTLQELPAVSLLLLRGFSVVD